MAIPTNIQANHHVGNVIEDIAMGIRAEDFKHVAFMFENLYSNPIAAVLREYATNAWDSHVFAGNTSPIEISLPTESNLELVIQDYGVGMSIDTLREIYSMYGASDKRETNSVAGQLGMGSKSALSYAAAFTVTAVRGGVKVIAMSTKDEHGLGVLKVLDTAGTSEPNGVKITIPVERWDVGRFRNEAENLFQFWDHGTVLVDGEAPEVPDWRSTALMLDDDTFLVRKDAGLYSSYVIMGNVPYPVPDATVGRVSHRFVARLNISDVDFAPSREAVRHTAHTDATLEELTEYINATYKRAIADQLASATSPWEEAMLKTLWMDRNVRLTTDVDHPIWTFDPNGWNRKAKSHFRYNLRDLALPSLVVITNFPAKNLSVVARDRLLEFTSGRKPTFLVLPAGLSGVSSLEGRPNTYTWEEVIGATNVAKADKPKVKREKYETQYAIIGAASMTATQLAEVTGKVLYLEPSEHASHGDLGATVVSLYSAAQLPRVKRFVPNIEPYNSEVTRQSAAAKEALTLLDSQIVSGRTLPDYFTKLNPADVNDPDLAAAITSAKMDDTPTMVAARRFGIAPKHKNLAEKFNKRYSLLAQVGYYAHRITEPAIRSEVVLYINAKWASIVAAQAEQVAS